MKMGLRDASNKDKMDKTIYQSDYFTGYGVKDWDVILSEPVHRELGRPGLVISITYGRSNGSSCPRWHISILSKAEDIWGHDLFDTVLKWIKYFRHFQVYLYNSTYITVFLGAWLHNDCLYRTWAHFQAPSSSMIMNCMWTNDVIMMSLRNLSQSLKIKGHEINFVKNSKKTNFQFFQ